MAPLALVTLLGLTPAVPPAHVHEITDSRGHHELIAHRHAQLHTGVSEHGRESTLDHDEDAVSIDAGYVGTASYALAAPAIRGTRAFVAPAHGTAVRKRSAFVEPLIHAPPRAPASLRAPPLQSVL